MRRQAVASAVLLGIALASAAGAEQKKKEPFYRSYLIAGNPLDDRIVEQEKRVEADPTSATLRNDFANLLAQRRFVGDARKQYNEAMKLDKKNFLAPYNLGLLEESEGNTSAAISAYKESIHRKKGFPQSRFRLGRLYEKTGSPTSAIEQYSISLRIDPTMRDPRRNPLAADSALMDRVSLTNYERDLATATEVSQERWADESRFARIPADRALTQEDVPEPAAAPASPTPPPKAPPPAGLPAAAPTPAPAFQRPMPPPVDAPLPPGVAATPTPVPRAPPPAGAPAPVATRPSG